MKALEIGTPVRSSYLYFILCCIEIKVTLLIYKPFFQNFLEGEEELEDWQRQPWGAGRQY